MGLFDKLKDILFDEETVEIPVITKEEAEIKTNVSRQPKKKIEDEEVIVRKVESLDDEDLFDMPKLKKEAEEEVRNSNFTFPIFEDDELDIKDFKRSTRYEEPKKEEKKVEIKEVKENKSKRVTKKYDFLTGTEYKTSEVKTSISPKSNSNTDEADKKPFKLSPIISPVYGILNENYKKEDIITRNDTKKRLSAEKVDLDSVRRKAYGSLEDEIENSLIEPVSAPNDIDIEETSKEEISLEDLSDDGISITDLLVDKNDSENSIKMNDFENSNYEDQSDTLGEDDLFDLIDSLYERKDDNQ